MFRKETAEVLAEVSKLSKKYPGLVDETADREIADPYVIAQAVVEKRVVVTEEVRVGANSQKTKIPNVCDGVGIKSVNFLGMVQELGWEF